MAGAVQAVPAFATAQAYEALRSVASELPHHEVFTQWLANHVGYLESLGIEVEKMPINVDAVVAFAAGAPITIDLLCRYAWQAYYAHRDVELQDGEGPALVRRTKRFN